MLFWAVILSAVIFIIIVAIDDFYNSWCALCATLAVLFCCTALVMGICVIANNANAEADHHELLAKRDAITWQMENGMYNNANEVGKRDLYKEATDFNATIARGKARQRNFWVGIFEPNIYDDIDFIEFDG